MRRGDVLMLDTGAVHDGYFCDFDRNYAIGRADDAARRGYHTLYAATQAGLAASRPGAACADLYHAMHRVIASFGGGDAEAGRLGLGMRLTEWPSLTPGDHTVLEPGMVLTLEPGLEMAPGRIMVHEENIVIRQDGPELLTRPAAPDLAGPGITRGHRTWARRGFSEGRVADAIQPVIRGRAPVRET